MAGRPSVPGLVPDVREVRQQATTRYEVLGPLRAWSGETEIDLGPAKQRGVLAVLLLHANRPVQPTAIIDAVWRDDPPANGTNVVQKHIAGLRRVLEPARSPRTLGGMLTLTDAGYVLAVDSGALDIDVVESLLAQARIERDGGDLAQAASHLRQAIDQWRADALAGLTGPVFDAARERFTETRADALESWADIELTLGHHGLIVQELGDLVTQFPVRERLRYLLILALYRCGRQAEALAAYRDAHRFLDDEFGVVPGAALTQLHQRILRADPGLMLPVAKPNRTGSVDEILEQHVPYAPTSYAPQLARALAPPVTKRQHIQRVVGTAFAVAIPLVSFGLMTWAVIAYYAARRRDPRLAFYAAGYLAAGFAALAIIGGSDQDSIVVLGVLVMVSLMSGGIVHVVMLNIIRPRSLVAQDLFLLEQRVRREHARQIMAAHPDIAEQLNIGCPHLMRTFDDGGLIDINVVPEQILSIMLGLPPAHAHHIATDRYARGPFRSVDDLVARGLLDEQSLSRLRDVLVAGPTQSKR